MATETDTPIPTERLDGAEQPYSRDRVYVQTAVVLAVLTVLEIFTHVWPDLFLWNWGDDSNIGVILWLMILMVIKFVIVVGVFMHLKYDKPILWRAFASGLVLAVVVYVAMLTMFRIFISGEAPL